jgi:hypothetical protein
MKEILRENKDAVREAGLALIEIGSKLAAGKIEDALKSLEDSRQRYREWEELDGAVVKIESAIRERASLLAVQQVVGEMVGVILGLALRSRLG